MASPTKRVTIQTFDAVQIGRAPDGGFVVYAAGGEPGYLREPVAAVSNKEDLMGWLEVAVDDERGFTVRL